ncbi:extracellular solute-binding protein [Paenibacillus ferrarius]|uniref:extracellular solute-binding protein n=1 Tax=Paenibacillus ferrarius TaxID=1469647 RepID=UPI003D2ABCC2
MLKKPFTLVVAIILPLTLVVGCSKSTDTPSASPTAASSSSTGKYDKELTITVSRAILDASTVKDDLEAKMLKEKFNLVFKAEDYSRNDWATKTTLLFSTGDGPEFIPYSRDQWKSIEWMSAGYLRPFELDEIKQKLPNYLKIWSNEEWDTVLKSTRFSDGKLYFLPNKRTIPVQTAWQYRKDLFDKYGLKFPKTPDDMINTLKTIKDKTGLIPFVVPGNSSSPLWAVSTFFQMFGFPDLLLTWNSYVDPATKQFYAYPLATDQSRNILVFLNKMYKNGLLMKDFATATADQTNKLIAQGNHVIAQTINDPSFMDGQQKAAAPDAKWAWVDNYDHPSNDPNKTIYKKESYYSFWGPAIKKGTSQEKVDRLLDYLNWAVSEEGQLWYTYGKEGVTYEKKDGVPTFLPTMSTPTQAQGDKLANYGINIGVIGLGGFITPYKTFDQTFNKAKLEMSTVIPSKPNYYGPIEPILQLSDADRKKLVGLETTLNGVRDEYWLKFIMGALDPSNDGDWKKFMDAANKAGLPEVVKLRTDAYNKANNS